MCKNDPYALHVNGEIDDVDDITAEQLYETYQSAIQKTSLIYMLLATWTVTRYNRQLISISKQKSALLA